MADYVYPFVRDTSYQSSHWDNAKAVDVFGPKGSAVVACTDGVAMVNEYSLGGHTVTLRGDDGRFYYHAHLVSGSGVAGRRRMGELIGRMDNTGNAQDRPPHCHWAVGSATYGIDDNGAGDLAPWPLLDEWRAQNARPPDVADAGDTAARIAQLEAKVSQLTEELNRERSWGSAMIVHVIKPGYALLGAALEENPPDRPRIAQVRDLLGRNGGQD